MRAFRLQSKSNAFSMSIASIYYIRFPRFQDSLSIGLSANISSSIDLFLRNAKLANSVIVISSICSKKFAYILQSV